MKKLLKQIIQSIKNKSPKLISFTILFTLLTVALIIIISGTNSETEVSYLEFQEMLNNNNIIEVYYVRNAGDFTFLSVDDITYIAPNPKTEIFKESVLLKDVKVIEKSPVDITGYFSLGLSLVLIFVIMRNFSGMMGSSGDFEMATKNQKKKCFRL